MMCKSKCSMLCPFSLAISLGLTAMLCMWSMLMWTSYSTGEATSTYMQHMMGGMESMAMWQIYSWVFLKGAFVGFFIALFYDFCRMIGGKMCGKSSSACTCPCNCCNGGKK